MPMPMPMPRAHCRALALSTAMLLLGSAAPASSQQLLSNNRAAASSGMAIGSLGSTGTPPGGIDPLLGTRSRLSKDWIGLRTVTPDTPILVMAGHADSQGISGSGTSGEAVALRGAAPMYRGISDEHYWNLVIAHAVASLGRQRGLRIDFYKPPVRTIVEGDDPSTNWSVGRDHAARGGYALEIHFDAYGASGVGSGLIPPLHRPFSTIDESLAREFGAYPMTFRDILGGPKRGIGLLEVGKLEGRLEASLRDPRTRQQTVNRIAERVVTALELGLGRQTRATGTASGNGVKPQPRGVRNARRGKNPPTSSAGG